MVISQFTQLSLAHIKNLLEIQIRTKDMHDFAERGIASHWQYKSSEKFSSLTWKEYDWLKDLSGNYRKK